jgi:hypothetical protein
VREPAPLPFLARPGYRRRRLIEAIRLLPYAGILLFFFPLLWPHGGDAAQTTSTSAIYLFAAWFALIVAAFLGARRLRRSDRRDDADGEAR